MIGPGRHSEWCAAWHRVIRNGAFHAATVWSEASDGGVRHRGGPQQYQSGAGRYARAMWLDCCCSACARRVLEQLELGHGHCMGRTASSAAVGIVARLNFVRISVRDGERQRDAAWSGAIGNGNCCCVPLSPSWQRGDGKTSAMQQWHGRWRHCRHSYELRGHAGRHGGVEKRHWIRPVA